MLNFLYFSGSLIETVSRVLEELSRTTSWRYTINFNIES